MTDMPQIPNRPWVAFEVGGVVYTEYADQTPNADAMKRVAARLAEMNAVVAHLLDDDELG